MATDHTAQTPQARLREQTELIRHARIKAASLEMSFSLPEAAAYMRALADAFEAEILRQSEAPPPASALTASEGSQLEQLFQEKREDFQWALRRIKALEAELAALTPTQEEQS